jgi:membrane protease YdiL (CAAX protease family)
MLNYFIFLAEWFPQNELFGEFSSPDGSMVAAVAFFLVLLCIGVAVDAGLVLFFIKRPAMKRLRVNELAERSLPGRMVGLILLMITVAYLLVSYAYVRLFPAAALDANAVIFQTLAFHFPVLILLVVLFRRAGISGHDCFGIRWKEAPRTLGLAVVLYLGALPLLWFYSLLYQLLLTRLGYEFQLQDVVLVLAADAVWPVRIAIFFIAIVVAPLFEEIVFRGILLPYAVRRAGFWPAALILSALFAGMHLHLPSMGPLFLLSLLFSLSYAWTKTLLVPIAMHACFNGVTIIILLLTGN